MQKSAVGTLLSFLSSVVAGTATMLPATIAPSKETDKEKEKEKEKVKDVQKENAPPNHVSSPIKSNPNEGN